MISFEAASPFPDVAPGTCSEREAREHSARVDRWLGFRTQEIEAALHERGSRARAPGSSGERQELWFGLDVQWLLTPYSELRYWLERLAPGDGQTIVDLGAAYGRMGLVMARHFPEVQFLGYEYVGERVEEARRIAKSFAPRASFAMEHADLANITPAAADIYFLYDYGTPKAIEKTLHDLRRIAESRAIRILVRGRHARYLIEQRHSWLAPLPLPSGEARASLYTSEPSPERAVNGRLSNRL